MAIKRRNRTMAKKPTQDYQSLEDYKKAVKAYLTKKLGVSEQVSESWMKKSDKALEGYWEDKLPVSATATGLMLNLL